MHCRLAVVIVGMFLSSSVFADLAVIHEFDCNGKHITVTRANGVWIEENGERQILFESLELTCGACDREGNLWIGGSITMNDSVRPTLSRYDWKEWTTWEIGVWAKFINVDDNNVVYCGNSTKTYAFDGVTWHIDKEIAKTPTSNAKTDGSTEATIQNSAYFPLALGNTWIYQREFWLWNYKVPYQDRLIRAIIETRTEAGKTEYEFLDGRVYIVNENGIIENFNFELRPCGEIECEDGTYYGDRYYRNDERMTVPAGTFDGYRFRFGDHILTWYFFAPSVGLVNWNVISDTSAWEEIQLESAIINGVVIGPSVSVEPDKTPAPLTLAVPFPNPFNASTTISFTLPDEGETSLTAYSITGQKVRTLLSGELAAGNYTVIWDAADDNGLTLSSGIYLLRLESGGMTATQRLAFVK